MSEGFSKKGRLFKVEFTIWLDERVCVYSGGELDGRTDGMAVHEALVVDRDYQGWVLDWQEQEIIVTDPREEEAPESNIAAIEMVLEAGTGCEGYDPTDSEICDAIDWEQLRRLVGRDPAPEVVLVEAPKGQTLEEWQEEMAELRQRAREAINEHEA